MARLRPRHHSEPDRTQLTEKFSEIAAYILALAANRRIYRARDALARAYGPSWLCNDVTRPFWSSGRQAGPEREVDMVAIRLRGVVPCPDANLRATRLRGRGTRVIDPSSLS
jgi:hypothetical protein